MNIYYLDEVDEPVFLPYQPGVKTRKDVEPTDYGDYVPSPNQRGKLIHRSRLIATAHDPVMPVLVMALLGAILGWGLKKFVTVPFDLIIWSSAFFGSLALIHFLYTLYRVVKFNRTP